MSWLEGCQKWLSQELPRMRQAGDGQLCCACRTRGDEASLNETWSEYQQWQADSENPRFTSRLLIVIPTDNESLKYLWPMPGHFVNAFAGISGKPLLDPAPVAPADHIAIPSARFAAIRSDDPALTQSARPAAIQSVAPAPVAPAGFAAIHLADLAAIRLADSFDNPLGNPIGNPAGNLPAYFCASFPGRAGGNSPDCRSGKASPFIWLRLLTYADWVLLVAAPLVCQPLPRFPIAGGLLAFVLSAAEYHAFKRRIFDTFCIPIELPLTGGGEAVVSSAAASSDIDLPASDSVAADSAASDSVAANTAASVSVAADTGKGRVTGVLPVPGGWRVYRAPAGGNPFDDIIAQWKRDGGGHEQQ